MAKPLRIGMIGYGFMGRAHTNGYKRVADFFDLEYTPAGSWQDRPLGRAEDQGPGRR